MTIKFSIRHHYKDVPIEITIEALDDKVTVEQVNAELEFVILWLRQARDLIDKLYEQTRKLTEKEKEKP